jgi:hypothetical protein
MKGFFKTGNLMGITITSLLFFSCGEGVKKSGENPATKNSKPTNVLAKNVNYIDSIKEKNGLIIKWAHKGKGSKLNDGDLVLISYVVTLPNGKLVDGSSKITKSDLPFLVGYNIQSKGWDEALRKMSVGDVATVILPSELGWSENSLGDALPANSDLLIQFFIVKKVPPAVTMNGSKIWRWNLLKPNKDDIEFGPQKTIKFNLIVNSRKDISLINTYTKKMVITNKFEDEFQPKSLKKALTNAKKNQGVFVLVSPQEVSEIKGVPQKLPVGESLFYNIQVVDVSFKSEK